MHTFNVVILAFMCVAIVVLLTLLQIENPNLISASSCARQDQCDGDQ